MQGLCRQFGDALRGFMRMALGVQGARNTLTAAALLALVVMLPSCGKPDNSGGKQVIVMGFDGMDPKLTKEMIAAGRLPNFSRLWEQSGVMELETSTPPQSPVAWSSVITGLNPGGHGIFDFIHRQPNPEGGLPIRPYASHEDQKPDGWEIPLLGRRVNWHIPIFPWFGYKVPMFPGDQILLRHGKPFWEYLTEAGIPTWIMRMPTNYPAQDSEGAEFYCLTDMGTPDLRQTNGEFSYYTSAPKEKRRSIGGGGDLYPISILRGKVKSNFYGPKDAFRADEDKAKKPVKVPFTLWRDPEDPVVRIAWQDEVVVAHQGEWTDWYPVLFELVPYVGNVPAQCRFFVKEVHPHVKLYVSPYNFDALDRGAPVSVPVGFAADVADVIGRFYTQGLPEETKGLSHKVLSRPQFLEQAQLIYEERMRLLDYALDHFTTGMMFFYFGSTDQIGHMFWGARTPGHPALTEAEQQRYAHEMERVYEDADQALGKVLDRRGNATIIVLSDHGFDTFTRGFNLNTWLEEHGYLYRQYETAYDIPLNIDFNRSRAYGMGINGLYINLQGREKYGIVDPASKQSLIDEITKGLLEYVDPQNGKRVIKEVYQCDKVYSGPYVEIGPDLQIGYDRTFRGSWDTVLGGVPLEIMDNNTDAWCADHCIATDLVPGILLANQPIRAQDPSLLDVAPTILAEFGIATPDVMEGRSVFDSPQSPAATR